MNDVEFTEDLAEQVLTWRKVRNDDGIFAWVDNDGLIAPISFGPLCDWNHTMVIVDKLLSEGWVLHMSIHPEAKLYECELERQGDFIRAQDPHSQRATCLAALRTVET